jgi:hypothetical protein
MNALDDRVDRSYAQLQRFDDRGIVAEAAYDAPSARLECGGDRFDQRELSDAAQTIRGRTEWALQRCL